MWQKHRTYPFAPRLLGQLHPFTVPPPLIVWRHLRRHVQIVFPVYMQVFCEQNPPVCTVVRKKAAGDFLMRGLRRTEVSYPPRCAHLSTFVHIF